MSGMNSEKLSARARQPGNDISFRASEQNFYGTLVNLLPETLWVVEDHPRDLAKLIDGRFGVIPEASITYLPTGRKVFFEVKKQGPGGNAEERASKHHTVRFYEVLREKYGYDYHPFVTIMCENLATDDKYVLKHPYFYKEDQYLLWKDYDPRILGAFLDRIREKWLA